MESLASYSQRRAFYVCGKEIYIAKIPEYGDGQQCIIYICTGNSRSNIRQEFNIFAANKSEFIQDKPCILCYNEYILEKISIETKIGGPQNG